MKKNYQKNTTSPTTPVLPEAVSVAMAELAGVQEGLLAMAVGTGLQVMAAMINADIEAVCGPRGRRDPHRSAGRRGSGDGSVTLARMAMQRMLAGLSTRRYPVGFEPVEQRVEASARSTSKSAVSRRFVSATETELGELLPAPLGDLDLVALMIDGVHFRDQLCVVAIGIGIGIRSGWPRAPRRTPAWSPIC